MKNQYFGDVNDYLKYGLLRCCAEAGWNVGVCWMLTPDDTRFDGRKVTYLSDPGTWRSHDPELYDALRTTVNQRRRDVAAAEATGILPRTRYFTEVVPDSAAARHEWLQMALKALSGSDLIFFDPDNGLPVSSKPKGRKDSSKYVFWDELDRAWNTRVSLMIFQHFPRENRETYAARRVSELYRHIPGSVITPLITSNVLFLLATAPGHADRAIAAFDLLRTRWGSRFRLQL